MLNIVTRDHLPLLGVYSAYLCILGTRSDSARWVDKKLTYGRRAARRREIKRTRLNQFVSCIMFAIKVQRVYWAGMKSERIARRLVDHWVQPPNNNIEHCRHWLLSLSADVVRIPFFPWQYFFAYYSLYTPGIDIRGHPINSLPGESESTNNHSIQLA